MTQQTLAEHLYVTRQAISRWECGDRYPDLIMAKKLAAFLEVSLDELLSTDEIKKVAERNQMALATLQWIRSHSNPINLGGDSALRVSVYKAI